MHIICKTKMIKKISFRRRNGLVSIKDIGCLKSKIRRNRKRLKRQEKLSLFDEFFNIVLLKGALNCFAV